MLPRPSFPFFLVDAKQTTVQREREEETRMESSEGLQGDHVASFFVHLLRGRPTREKNPRARKRAFSSEKSKKRRGKTKCSLGPALIQITKAAIFSLGNFETGKIRELYFHFVFGIHYE